MEPKNDSLSEWSLRQALLDATGAPLRAPEPPPQRQEARDLDGLLDLMRRLVAGEPGLAAVELGPQGCSDLLGIVRECDMLRDALTVAHDRVKAVQAAREAAYAKLNAAHDEIRGLRLEVGELRCAFDQSESALAAANSVAKQEAGSLHKAIEALREDLATARVNLMNTQVDLTSARKTLVDVAAERDALKADFRTLMAERDDLASRLADLSELVLDDDGTCGEHQEPPRHLHCCECDQCQPPPRGMVVINVLAGGQVVVG